MKLEQLGWNPAFEESFACEPGVDVFPARVAFASRGICRLLGPEFGAEGECAATLSGKARNDPRGVSPVVGDWVAARRIDADTALILAVLPRQSVLARGGSGGRKSDDGAPTGEQVLAANVNTSLIVCGLDRDFNPRRIERYIALSYGGGVQPVVLLNKADICPDAGERADEVARLAPGVDVVALSAKEGLGVDRVRSLLGPGVTVCLLGSSGAGKSTLLNALSTTPAQSTGSVSDATGKGRHTTTSRELFVLPGGIIVIDTPGLREVALADGEGLNLAFPEVEELAQRCRFRDCAHEGEPGCAVRDAVGRGEISEERWGSFLRLQSEARYRERVADTHKTVVEKARWKSVSKTVKQFYKMKG
jgi:ribosome biogenesis GTPase